MYITCSLKFIALCLLISIISCSNRIGYLDQKGKTYKISNFEGVSFSGSFKIYAKQGNSEGLTLKGRPEDLQKIEAYVSSGRLVVKVKKNKGWYSRMKTITAELQFKNLSSIDLSGSCEWKGSNSMTFENMRIDMSGASECMQKLMGETLKVDGSGASDMELSGKVNTFNLDLSGSCEIDADLLECKKVSLESSGASELSVHVTEELKVDASGASTIKYKGSPTKVNSSTSGASTIRKIE